MKKRKLTPEKLINLIGNCYEFYEKRLNKKDNKEWFKNLWDNEADMYEFFELAKEIREDIDFKHFEKGWEYRNVLQDDKKQAKIEFLNILIGFY